MKKFPRNDDGKYLENCFPGGYDIQYLCKDGAFICGNCLNTEEEAKTLEDLTEEQRKEYDHSIYSTVLDVADEWLVIDWQNSEMSDEACHCANCHKSIGADED